LHDEVTSNEEIEPNSGVYNIMNQICPLIASNQKVASMPPPRFGIILPQIPTISDILDAITASIYLPQVDITLEKDNLEEAQK
jgi:hypothetical protein